MVSSFSLKLTATEVSLVTFSVYGSAGNSPAFMTVKSIPDAKSFSSLAFGALISMFFMKRAW